MVYHTMKQVHLQKEILYLISSNYKIVYMIVKYTVTITTEFDCRQNPIKLSTTDI